VTAAELELEPASQETLALLRLEQKINDLYALVARVVRTQEELERRIEDFLGPAMDIIATLHQIGESLAKLLASGVKVERLVEAYGKALEALRTEVRDLTRAIRVARELTDGFDNDPTRRLVKI
jgi:K+/H+ antiporter YhaU regulatory subunit KhtT